MGENYVRLPRIDHNLTAVRAPAGRPRTDFEGQVRGYCLELGLQPVQSHSSGGVRPTWSFGVAYPKRASRSREPVLLIGSVAAVGEEELQAIAQIDIPMQARIRGPFGTKAGSTLYQRIRDICANRVWLDDPGPHPTTLVIRVFARPVPRLTPEVLEGWFRRLYDCASSIVAVFDAEGVGFSRTKDSE